MLLKDIALTGFQGTAPTPVEKLAINNYFVNDELFNLLEFVNMGMGTGGTFGNIAVTVVTYDKPDKAGTRRIGEEYTISNNPPKPVTIFLKQIGGAFSTDRVLARSFRNDKEALDNWTDQQIRQKINAIINSYAELFIKGNASSNPNEFDGMQVYFANHPEQVVSDPLVLAGGLTFNTAIQVEQFLNNAISLVNKNPTCVITTRGKGESFLKTLEGYRNRGTTPVKIWDKDYYTFMGIPIVRLDESCFPEAMLTNGTPFIFARFNEVDGIRVCVPMNPGIGTQGAVIDIVRPNLGNNMTGEAVFVRNGGVEICSAPIIVDYQVASLCYISEVPVTPVTSVTVAGSATITTKGGSSAYTATVAPESATNKAILWTVVNGTGSAIIDQTGKLTAVSDGTVTVVATSQDGSGVSGSKTVTISNQES